MTPSMDTPQCSVGMPIYNRPDMLAAALAGIRRQTYQNLEIIISDNASPDPKVATICRQAERDDPRIRYVRQKNNVGARANFDFVLKQATAPFFMWAADDDRRAPDAIARMMAAFSKMPSSTVLTVLETQYVTPDGDFPFFAEGRPFYEPVDMDRVGRIAHVLRHGYGDLIYGVFRREALFANGDPVTRWFGPTLNELPLFAAIAAQGDLRALPEIGLFKRAPAHVCRQARWEQQGGFSPQGPRLGNPKRLINYHRRVAGEIHAVLDALELTPAELKTLTQVANRSLTRHAFLTGIGWKPRRVAEA